MGKEAWRYTDVIMSSFISSSVVQQLASPVLGVRTSSIRFVRLTLSSLPIDTSRADTQARWCSSYSFASCTFLWTRSPAMLGLHGFMIPSSTFTSAIARSPFLMVKTMRISTFLGFFMWQTSSSFTSNNLVEKACFPTCTEIWMKASVRDNGVEDLKQGHRSLENGGKAHLVRSQMTNHTQ